MSVERKTYSPDTLPPARGYVHTVEVSGGRTIYVSGQVGMTSNRAVVGVGDLKAQTAQAFENLSGALAAAGATLRDVVKLTFFVLDFADFDAVREVRDRYLDGATLPTATSVAVARLFHPDLLIEIEAVAVVP